MRSTIKRSLITAGLTASLVGLISPAGMAQPAYVPAIDFEADWPADFGVAAPPLPETRAREAWRPRLQSAPGTVIRVTTTQDELNEDGDCSLREAIEAANLDVPVDACPAGFGKDTVVVPKGTYRLSITGAEEDKNQTGDLDILDDLVLVGKGAKRTILDGDRLDRILDVHPGRTVEVKRVTITRGRVQDFLGAGILNQGTLTLTDAIVSDNEIVSVFAYGGAVATMALVGDATTTVNNSVVADNSAPCCAGIMNIAATGHKAQTTVNDSIIQDNTAEPFFAGGLYNGYLVGASDTVSIMDINNSLVEGNTASERSGGGILSGAPPSENAQATLTVDHSRIQGNAVTAGADGYGNGGGLWAGNSTLTIRNSTIDGNAATCEGFSFCGLGAGIALRESVSTRVEASTVSHNTASTDGFGALGGGGLLLVTGPVTIVNSTVSGNEMTGAGLDLSSGLGGGIAVLALFGPTTVDLVNTTIADNRANVAGGGLAAENAGVTVTFVNSLIGNNHLIAGEQAVPDTENCFDRDSSKLQSLGNNLEDHDQCEFDPAFDDLPNTDPVIGLLADNGGPTQTHALLPDSPAINAGNDIAAPETDQRGVPRPQGPASDIGAYEAEAMYVAGIQINGRRGDDDDREGRDDDEDKGRLIESRVRIRAQEGGPVPEATVRVEWTLPGGATQVQQDDTNEAGFARFALKPTRPGVYEICVEDVRKDGWTYDPAQNRETCETLRIRPGHGDHD